MDESLSIDFCGLRLELLGAGALYWSKKRVLFVADLHLGKAETLQAFGQAMPSGHSLADLERLAALAKSCGADQVYILGDLIHAKAGLTNKHVAEVGNWLRGAQLELSLILGNHDHYAGGVPKEWNLDVLPEGSQVGGLTLNHHPSEGDVPRLCGHLHPVIQLGSKLDAMRLPCFVVETSQIILPAFGSVTGGASVRPRSGRNIYAAAGEGVIQIPSKESAG